MSGNNLRYGDVSRMVSLDSLAGMVSRLWELLKLFTRGMAQLDVRIAMEQGLGDIEKKRMNMTTRHTKRNPSACIVYYSHNRWSSQNDQMGGLGSLAVTLNPRPGLKYGVFLRQGGIHAPMMEASVGAGGAICGNGLPQSEGTFQVVMEHIVGYHLGRASRVTTYISIVDSS